MVRISSSMVKIKCGFEDTDDTNVIEVCVGGWMMKSLDVSSRESFFRTTVDIRWRSQDYQEYTVKIIEILSMGLVIMATRSHFRRSCRIPRGTHHFDAVSNSKGTSKF